MSSTMTMKSMKTTIDLDRVRCCSQVSANDLRNCWLHHILDIVEIPQRPGIRSNDENHHTYPNHPERHKDSLFPHGWLLRHVGVSAFVVEAESGEQAGATVGGEEIGMCAVNEGKE